MVETKKEFLEKVKILKSFDKNILVRAILGMNANTPKRIDYFIKYIKKELKKKK